MTDRASSPNVSRVRSAVTAAVVDRKARPESFSELCDHLAGPGGGYTLWVGAGASIAASGGATPGWETLIEKLVVEAEAATGWTRPDSWPAMDMPDRLERISSALSHPTFRRRLREALVDPFLRSAPLGDVILDQALVGARASNVVSFNIEMISSLALGLGQGGAFVPRTYLPPTPYAPPVMTIASGTIGNTVYYPHGLLDIQGACVMTRSEYDLHGASLAAGAAVSLCLGGDLLVLGMSLSDRYLRDAILRGRQWIRDIYWVNERFPHAE